jgi:hypothetical protein
MGLGEQIVGVLRPDTLGDIFIYIIFLLALIASAVIPEKNVQAPYMMYGVILCCIIDLLRGNNGQAIPVSSALRIGGESLFSNQGFITYLLHIIMFTFPLIAAGLVRRHGRKGALAIPVCLLCGLFGGIYTFMAFIAPTVVYGRLF